LWKIASAPGCTHTLQGVSLLAAKETAYGWKNGPNFRSGSCTRSTTIRLSLAVAKQVVACIAMT